MLKQEEKKELVRKFGEAKNEVKKLKDRLNEVNALKEGWFEKKEKSGKDISRLLKQVREAKSRRDALVKEIKEKKERREEYNNKIKKNIEEIKRLESEKREIIKKYNIRGDPSKIKEESQKLEMMIETEALSFEKEKELMKKIKGLKKNYKDAEEVSNIWERISDISKETEQLKQMADETHKEIQSRALISQQKHEEMVGALKSLKALEEKEEEEHKGFMDYKRRFGETNNELKEKLAALNEMSKTLSEERERAEAEKKQAAEVILKGREEEIRDKLKRKKKLTTEDILAFQQIRED